MNDFIYPQVKSHFKSIMIELKTSILNLYGNHEFKFELLQVNSNGCHLI